MMKAIALVLSACAVWPASASAQERRDALGDPLPAGVLWRQGTTRLRHQGGILGLAFAPDGKRLASCGYDGAVRVWDVADGKPLQVFFLDGPTSRPFNVAFSPDGRLLAVADADVSTLSAVRVFDTHSAKQTLRLPGMAISLAFSADGKRLIACGYEVAVWSVQTGRKLHETTTPPEKRRLYIYSFALLGDGKTIAYARYDYWGKGDDIAVVLWDSETGKETRLEPRPSKAIRSMALSTDRQTLACGAHEHVLIWDTSTWKQTNVLKTVGHPLAMMPRSSKLVVLGRDLGLHAWDTATGKKETMLARPVRPPAQLTFSPDGKMLATGDSHGTICLWDAATGKETFQRSGHDFAVYSLAVSPDGKTLASHGGEFSVRLWDLPSGKERRILTERPHADPPGQRAVQSLAFSRDGGQLAGVDGGDTLFLWDAASGKMIRSWKTRDGASALALSSDGKRLAMCGGDPKATLWDVEAGIMLEQLVVTSGPKEAYSYVLRSVALAPDGRTVAGGLSAMPGWATSPISPLGPEIASLCLWDVGTAKEKGRLSREGQYAGTGELLFSPDGRLLISRSEERARSSSLRLWSMPSGKLLRELKVPEFGAPAALAISRDGRYLAVGYGRAFTFAGAAADGSQVVCLWELLTGTVAWERRGHQADIFAVAFTPDTRTLLTGSKDTTILAWSLAPPSLDRAKQVAALEPKELERLWSDLAEREARPAYRAIWTLASRPEEAVAFLQTKLEPDPPLAADLFDKLIRDLDSEVFATRQKAEKALRELGGEAESSLTKALAKPASLEGERRLRTLLEQALHAPPAPPQLQQLRAIAILEHIAGPEARALLTRLVRGRSTSPQTTHAAAALNRIRL